MRKHCKRLSKFAQYAIIKKKRESYMPAAYTHFVFAEAVFAQLSKDLQFKIQKHIDLYRVGAHGPDLLFYYKPLQKNPINQIGHTLHKLSAAPFFQHAKQIIRSDEAFAPQAYTFGFITHFILDQASHSYINTQTQTSALTHAEIETALDRSYFIESGKNPLRCNPAGHIHQNRQAATVIAPFFQIPWKPVYQAMASMRRYNALLLAPNPLIRCLLQSILRLSKNHELLGLIMTKQDNPACANTTQHLRSILTQNVSIAAQCITDFQQHIDDDNLPAIFQNNFD